jgi:hypothetical protein
MADPARFELTTSAFGGQRSIGLLARRHSPGGPAVTTTQMVTINECRSRRLRARYSNTHVGVLATPFERLETDKASSDALDHACSSVHADRA